MSISYIDKLLLTRELSVLLKSGVPLGEALSSLRHPSQPRGVQRMIDVLVDDVENGQSLSHAFARFPNTFDALYVNMVQVGEISGTLRENLEFLARQLDDAYRLRKKIQGILLYPMIVLTLALLLGAVLSIYILPRLIRLFDAFTVSLPWSTRFLLSIASFMQHHGLVFFAGIFGGILLTRVIVATPFVKPLWHRVKLSLPPMSGLLRDVTLAHFCRDMGIMLQSGLPILEALAVEEKVTGNVYFARLVAGLGKAVTQGKPLSVELSEKRYAVIPPLAVKMIAAGEKTGRLDEILLFLEHFFEEEADRKMKNLTVLFEPFLLICIGLVVGFLALAILSPIYSLTGSVGR